MSGAPRPRHGAPSWLGTLVVALAVVVMCLRAAAELRGAVSREPERARPPAGAGSAR